MKNELFKPEVEKLLNQLEKISPKNVSVCKKACRDSYSSCLDAGKNADSCKSTFLSCIDSCLSSGLNKSESTRANELLLKLKEKL
ncbi:MAG: hypothetical protein ACTIJ9_14735 [Aequorivita sp.]